MTKAFDNNIIQKIGVTETENDFDKDYLTPTYEYCDDDHQDATPDTPPEKLTPIPEVVDNHVNIELMLPRGGTLERGRVKERKRDHEGSFIGRSNANPILDTREYEVKFEDGDVTKLTANAIAESMYAMCNENSDHILLFDAIVDHKNNYKAMTRAEQKFVNSRRKQQYKRSTKGWEVCARRKNGSTTWEKLSDFKECYPVQTPEYAVTNDIDTEPVFNYWVPHTLKKRDSIISLVNKPQTRYLNKTHKFGIDMPKTVKEAAE